MPNAQGEYRVVVMSDGRPFEDYRISEAEADEKVSYMDHLIRHQGEWGVSGYGAWEKVSTSALYSWQLTFSGGHRLDMRIY